MRDPEPTNSAPVSGSRGELGVLVTPIVLVALQRVVPAERLVAESAHVRLLHVRALVVSLLVVRASERLVAPLAVEAFLRRRRGRRGRNRRHDGPDGVDRRA